MQVYAFDENRPLLAAKAEKGKNYYCPECQGVVRLRRGDQRQAHFFHLKLKSSCRLSQKGAIHLQLQYFVKGLFEAAEMEKPFPEIGRIADVADCESKIIFEIQYSPMSLEEAKGRCHDYESIGYQIVWILHDRTYNQKKITATERFLRTKTCYYSNFDETGKGIIYDQLDEIRGKWRRRSGERLPVDLGHLVPLPMSKWPKELQQRAQTWPLYCVGDLIDLSLKNKFVTHKDSTLPRLKEMYLTFLHMCLLRSSK